MAIKRPPHRTPSPRLTPNPRTHNPTRTYPLPPHLPHRPTLRFLRRSRPFTDRTRQTRARRWNRANLGVVFSHFGLQIRTRGVDLERMEETDGDELDPLVQEMEGMTMGVTPEEVSDSPPPGTQNQPTQTQLASSRTTTFSQPLGYSVQPTSDPPAQPTSNPPLQPTSSPSCMETEMDMGPSPPRTPIMSGSGSVDTDMEEVEMRTPSTRTPSPNPSLIFDT